MAALTCVVPCLILPPLFCGACRSISAPIFPCIICTRLPQNELLHFPLFTRTHLPQDEFEEEEEGDGNAILVTDADTPSGEQVLLQLILARCVFGKLYGDVNTAISQESEESPLH